MATLLGLSDETSVAERQLLWHGTLALPLLAAGELVAGPLASQSGGGPRDTSPLSISNSVGFAGRRRRGGGVSVTSDLTRDCGWDTNGSSREWRV